MRTHLRWPGALEIGAGLNLDGGPVVTILYRGADAWTSYSVIRLNAINQRIDHIVRAAATLQGY